MTPSAWLARPHAESDTSARFFVPAVINSGAVPGHGQARGYDSSAAGFQKALVRSRESLY